MESNGNGMRHWLQNIHQYGLGFVSNVPKNAEKTKELAEKLSVIRNTHYGGFWDLTPDLEHGDTAYTTAALSAHTDTTYFTDPVG
jgi:trimethyllysine dioxygenase